MQYKTFKVAMLDQWLVIVSGADMNEELRKVPDSHADFLGAADEVHAWFCCMPRLVLICSLACLYPIQYVGENR